MKLTPIRHKIEGKKLVVIDDSIVRGTTSKRIVRMLKEAGAAEVHMRIASPASTGACYYGVDTPDSNELMLQE
jgi:amidophosphoribosyltransferase